MEQGPWLDVVAAAEYLSVRTERFTRLVRAGTIPPGSAALGQQTARWSVTALDDLMTGRRSEISNMQRIEAYAQTMKPGRKRAARLRGDE